MWLRWGREWPYDLVKIVPSCKLISELHRFIGEYELWELKTGLGTYYRFFKQSVRHILCQIFHWVQKLEVKLSTTSEIRDENQLTNFRYVPSTTVPSLLFMFLSSRHSCQDWIQTAAGQGLTICGCVSTTAEDGSAPCRCQLSHAIRRRRP